MDEQATPGHAELTDAEKRRNVITLAFGGDASRLDAFCEHVRKSIPPGTGVVLRGSAVTGERWDDGAPFDADGPGTSDLDLTLVGAEVLSAVQPDGILRAGRALAAAERRRSGTSRPT